MAMSSTAASKDFSQEMPMITPNISTISTMPLSTWWSVASESAMGSRMKIHPRHRAVISNAAMTRPRQSPSVAKPIRTKTEPMENMKAHAKMKFGTIAKSRPKWLFRYLSNSGTRCRRTTVLKLYTAKMRPMRNKSLDSAPLSSSSGGRSPSGLGMKPAILNRSVCTTRKEIVRPVTSAINSSTSSSQIFSFSSNLPSRWAT
mmetsp:Transcript_48520/g.139335  ORF Transcript_48520/g.139335 Transcript_48520/m.139335 type:complete len:202 (+) Transcript_48520:609-1214(+)